MIRPPRRGRWAACLIYPPILSAGIAGHPHAPRLAVPMRRFRTRRAARRYVNDHRLDQVVTITAAEEGAVLDVRRVDRAGFVRA